MSTLPPPTQSCFFYTPYPRWAQSPTPSPQESYENWSKVEQWAKDFIHNNCIGDTPNTRTSTPPQRCILLIPYKDAYLDGVQIEENWLALERWVTDILLNYTECFDCAGAMI